METTSSVPNYAVVIYRADGVTELHSKNVWELSTDRTWALTPSFQQDETAVLRLWRNDNPSYGASWSSWKSNPARVEVTSLSVAMQSDRTYTLTAPARAAERVRFTVETADGNVVETSSAPPNFALVLYRAGGVTELGATDVWALATDRTWTLDPPLKDGDTAVVKLWRNDDPGYGVPGWSSWKTNPARVEVASQSFVISSGQTYLVTSPSRGG